MTDKNKTSDQTNSHYLYTGNTVKPMPAADMRSTRVLANGTYEVQYNQDRGFYLNKIDDMMVPSEVYGDTASFASRVVTTYLDRGCNTGVLLEGEQGSGKTMLSKLVSAALRELDMPTIVINTAFVGPGFNAFMAAIDTPCMVFFDEFEKTYAKQEEKEQILTFFDGVFDSNKLIICTVNNKSRMSTHMLNRPGRLFYSMSYNRLALEVVEEYCTKNLNDKTQVASIKQITTIYGGFNFDMLKALVEEMNRYKCKPKEALKYLNIKPSYTKFRTGTVFVPVGYNETNKEIFLCDKPCNPPTGDLGIPMRVTEVSEEIVEIAKNMVLSNALDKVALVELMARSIASNNGSSSRYGQNAYMEPDSMLAYDADSGCQTYDNEGYIVKFIPLTEAVYKEIHAESKTLGEEYTRTQQAEFKTKYPGVHGAASTSF